MPHANHLAAVQQCLRRPSLARLIGRANQIARINDTFRSLVPPNMQDHAVLTRLETDAWIIQADSSAWATRLRYSLPRLRRRLAEQLNTNVPTLRVRVKPADSAPPPPPPPRRLRMSHEAADLIEGTAKSMSDQRLAAALKRLAKHGKHR